MTITTLSGPKCLNDLKHLFFLSVKECSVYLNKNELWDDNQHHPRIPVKAWLRHEKTLPTKSAYKIACTALDNG